MSSGERPIWIRVASGRVKGPFSKAQVSAAWKAGKLPAGCALSAAESGPWKPVEQCFRAPANAGPASMAPASTAPTQAAAPVRAAAVPAAPAAAAAPAPASASDGALAVDTTLHGFAGSKAILAAAWRAVRTRYGAIVLRSSVVMTIVGLLAALPTLVALAAVVASLTLGEDSVPGIKFLLGLGLVFDLLSMLVLVPFAMMFASAGCYMILGVATGQAFGAWRTLFSWTGRITVMYPIGLLGTVNELFSGVIERMLSGQNSGSSSRPDLMTKLLGTAIESAPWAILVLAGVAVLDARTRLGIKSALQWALRSCVSNGMLGLMAIAIASLVAVVTLAMLVVPAYLVGYPLLLLVIGTLYLHAKVRVGEPAAAGPAGAGGTGSAGP